MTNKTKEKLKLQLKKALKSWMKEHDHKDFKEAFPQNFLDLKDRNIEYFIFSDRASELLNFSFYALQGLCGATYWNEIRIYPLSRKTEKQINKKTEVWNCFSLVIDSDATLNTDSKERFIKNIIEYEEKARKIIKIINSK